MTDQTSNSAEPPAAEPQSWLNRNVFAFGATSLLADLCYETATTVLPALLVVVGAPPFALGLMEGLADALSSFVKMAAGWYSDLLPRRKPFVVFGYGVTAVSIGLIGLVTLWPIILLLRVAAWIGKGARGPARNAMLTASVPPADKGKAFGFHRAGDTIGAIIGPLVAAALIGRFGADGATSAEPYQWVMLATLVPGLASAAVVAIFVTEPRRGPSKPRQFWESLAALPPRYRRWLVAIGVFGAGDFSHTLLILGAINALTPTRGFVEATQIGAVLFSVRNIAAAVAAFPVGAVSDRIGRQGLLFATYLLGAIVVAAFGVVVTFDHAGLPLLTLLFVGAGIVNAAQEALEGAAASDLVPDHTLHGTAFGLLGAVNGVGDFISSVIVGALWTIAPEIGFGYAAIMMFLGAGLLLRVAGNEAEANS
ncbi:MFS transporter [Lacipirellula sp.]|uniref:MFS transporter n=1 Tax=Lacipirellula sp. TaxID=2691419 RepID=UPI003D0C2F72